jgi:hypothetical protein
MWRIRFRIRWKLGRIRNWLSLYANPVDRFWRVIGFMKYGRMYCKDCGNPLTYLWHPGVKVYDIPSKEWVYFCGWCPDVVFLGQPHPKTKKELLK